MRDTLELSLEKLLSKLNIYWENLIRKHFLWNSLFIVDTINHISITKEVMDMGFIVFNFIIASQFCIPNVMLSAFCLQLDD